MLMRVCLYADIIIRNIHRYSYIPNVLTNFDQQGVVCLSFRLVIGYFLNTVYLRQKSSNLRELPRSPTNASVHNTSPAAAQNV